MSKKLLSIFLCLIMFAMPLLTACGGSEEEGAETGDDAVSEEVRLPMTLSLWLPTDESTTDEAIKLVENEINKLVQAKYNTAIELHAISEDEYQQVIDDKIKDIDDVQKAAESAAESERLQQIEYAIEGVLPEERGEVVQTEAPDEDETEIEIETEVNEYGQSITVYPEVDDDQLDIFLVKGYDNYRKYIDEGLIESLDSDINDVGKKLYSTIYPSFFDLAKVEGSIYGIPNNHALGEYQFLLVNKELAEEYDYHPSELDTFVKCEGFINDIGSQNLPGVTPLLGKVEAANMVYFSSDGKWSVLGQQIGAGVEYNTELKPANIIQSTQFRPTYMINKKLEAAGYIGDGVIDDGEKFAVGVVSGDASLRAEFEEDYYIYTHAVPVADVDGALESAFCVSKYTKDTKRAMEVLTYINTDQTIRTILQYGVEDLHWEKTKLDGEDVISIVKDGYKMNILDTGNVYLTYPAPGVPMSYWENAKIQNRESSTNPFVGFEYLTDDNADEFRALEKFSAECWNNLESATGETITQVTKDMVGLTMENKALSKLLLEEPTEDITDAVVYLYLETYLKGKK